MAVWTGLSGLIRMEIIQRREEGCNVDGFDELRVACGEEEGKLMKLYEELSRLAPSPDFPYDEPSELEAIRRLRPDGPRRLEASYSEEQWRDRFRGAWLGRLSGCALGKPLESEPMMAGANGNPGWRNVQLWFEGADAWPIRGYTPERSRAESQGLRLSCLQSTRERIRFMESDDDVRYTALGMLMMEQKGLDWDSWDIGKLWHSRLTYGQVFTAEQQAYYNFAKIVSHMPPEKPADWLEKQEWVRTYLNPFREWIGAQIRADGFAYTAAGNPELAAELAWRDASFSHTKNGIYGEMFVAAMIAAAFVESDPHRIVAAGLREIPSTSRLASDIARAVDIADSSRTQLELVDRIWEAFKHYHQVHTNNNAALVAAALIHSKGDFERGITTAVLGGWDTDCNGATVGSILGASIGASALPASWIEPLNDTFYADMTGFDPVSISSCAERSYQTFLNVREQLSRG